jgi:hypothetical protein
MSAAFRPGQLPPYPPGYGFPLPFGWRHSLLEPSCPRWGIGPRFRRSLGLPSLRPDHNGIAAFRTSETRSGWVLPVLRGRGVRARTSSEVESTFGPLIAFPTILSATLRYGASSAVYLRSPVRSSPCPVRPYGSGLPWASPLCCRTLRYLALAGVRDRIGHYPEP